jgi:hypothetical protein
LKSYKKIRKGLKNLIEEKLIPIIKESQPLDDVEEELKFFYASFGYVVYKLQRHIMKKLKVEPI